MPRKGWGGASFRQWTVTSNVIAELRGRQGPAQVRQYQPGLRIEILCEWIEGKYCPQFIGDETPARVS